MIHNFSLFLVFFQYFFAEIEFSLSSYLQVNIKFLVKFARQSLLWASGKVMCFSEYTVLSAKIRRWKVEVAFVWVWVCESNRKLDLSLFSFTGGGTVTFLASVFVWVSQTTGKLDLLLFLFYLRGHSCLLGLSWWAFILKVWVQKLAWRDWVVLIEKTLHYHCVCLANGLHPPILFVLHSHPPVCIQ